ncbi:UNVERIFIED_CONTAM: hypothetical protein FKN15_033671 [Acipenser sinensis]
MPQETRRFSRLLPDLDKAVGTVAEMLWVIIAAFSAAINLHQSPQLPPLAVRLTGSHDKGLQYCILGGYICEDY